jgi:hypothetical protein
MNRTGAGASGLGRGVGKVEELAAGLVAEVT